MRPAPRSSFANPLLHTPSRPLPSRVAIVGAGTIGPDIGYYLKAALPGLELVLVDIDQRPLDAARKRLEGYAAKGLARKKITAEQARAVGEGIVTTTDYGAMEGCEWVIEAATERLDLKRRIFAQVEEIVGPQALITSNTSSLPAGRLFTELKRPERATVTHFFAPAWRNPAVEVISWERLDPAALDDLCWLLCRTGKVPLVTSDDICFMLDRIFDNWCNEAALLLDGATASQVDSVCQDVVAAGPFFVLNMANGNPIIVEANTLQCEEGEHYRPADIFRSVERWTTVRPGRRIAVAPELAAKISDRMLGGLFSQSYDIVDRGIGSPADLELGCQLALGFKAGPFALLADRGPDETARIDARFQADRPGMPGPASAHAAYQDFRRHVLVDRVGDVVVLTLRRPQAMNALDDRVTDELLDAVRVLAPDPEVTGFVITGFGTRAFCAGADIGRFPQTLGDFEAAADFARACSRLLVHIDEMDKPVVAALGGLALGGGLELALRCHGVVAVSGARLQFPEITLGIAPGIGGMVVPFRRWPAAAEIFAQMLRCGTRMSAVQAHELGVVDALAADHAELFELAFSRVRALALEPRPDLDGPVALPPLPAPHGEGPPLSVEVMGIIDAAIRDAAAADTLGEALEIGYRAFGSSACTAAAREGITAFGERRRPDFTRTG